jgi:hypothetical protein
MQGGANVADTLKWVPPGGLSSSSTKGLLAQWKQCMEEKKQYYDIGTSNHSGITVFITGESLVRTYSFHRRRRQVHDGACTTVAPRLRAYL